MRIEDKHIVYFLGIGGIGMSALARWFLHLGKKVYGYDKTETPLTLKLVEEGAIIHYDDAVENIVSEVQGAKEDVLVILTPAVPKNHKELNYFHENNFSVLKRSEVLGLITKDLYSVAVAGTHGKTTTSSMIAHILKSAGRSSMALMGGILQGYESNLIIEGEHSKDTIAVLEADEYDRSFLRLSPDIAVVTSADPDHLDIYGAHEEMKSSFQEFIQKVKPNGHVFINEILISWLAMEKQGISSHTYALGGKVNYAKNTHISDTDFVFDFHGENDVLEGVRLAIPGYHNVENAIVAIAVCLQLGIEKTHIKAALSSFKGVKRRFEYHLKSENLVYIDDYAHHPVEIKAFIGSVKQMYPGKKITAIFQPHLFTRTRDFVDGFAESLSMADEVILMNIYPARELPIEGITSKIIFDKITHENKHIIEDAKLLDTVDSMDFEVILTIGAGNIDRFVASIATLLKEKV